MKLFKREKIEEKVEDNNQQMERARDGIQKLLENGFLVDNKDADEGYLYDGQISIRSEMFSLIQGVIEGDDDENIEKLDSFFRKNFIKQIYTIRGDGPMSFNPEALLDIAAFIVGNRDLEANEPVYIDGISKGLEITCKAAPPEKRTMSYAEYLMKNSLQDAIAACGRNGNGYPIITFDEETGELTAAIYLPLMFENSITEDVIKTVKDTETNAFRDKKIKYLDK